MIERLPEMRHLRHSFDKILYNSKTARRPCGRRAFTLLLYNIIFPTDNMYDLAEQ